MLNYKRWRVALYARNSQREWPLFWNLQATKRLGSAEAVFRLAIGASGYHDLVGPNKQVDLTI